MADQEKTRQGRFLPPLFFLLIVSGTGLLYLSHTDARTSYPLDDAWIHMVYARNLADGYFFAYNAPDPEAGFTSPLWVVLMALVQVFTESVVAPKILGLILLFFLAWAVSRHAGSAAGLLLLLDPWFQSAALSGMEVILFSLFSILALQRQHRGRPGHAGWWAAGALLSRPEGLVVIPLLWLASFGATPPRKGFWKPLILVTWPSLLAATLWIIFCLGTTGRPLPNTFYVKLQMNGLFDLETLPQILTLFFTDLYRFLSHTSPACAGLIIFMSMGAILYRPDLKRLTALFLFTGLFAGTWFTRPILRIEAFYWARYFIPALTGLYLLTGFFLQRLWRSESRYLKGSALLLALVLGACLVAQNQRFASNQALNCRDIARFNMAAGKWIAEHTAPEDRIAVHDAGAIRYFGQREVLDLGGLNSHTLTDLTPLINRVDIADSAALAAYLDADWLVIFERHLSRSNLYKPVYKIRYDDYSLYVHPEPFSLLLLKKAFR
ncbi:MAG: hypothetical protein KJ645_08180 [Planctomycetes bacterium]|nr:hypothetical protein [Planctomycetota bacterium]